MRSAESHVTSSSHLRNQPPNHAAVQQTGLQPLAATNKQRAKCIRFVAAYPGNTAVNFRQIQRIVEPAGHLSTSTGRVGGEVRASENGGLDLPVLQECCLERLVTRGRLENQRVVSNRRPKLWCRFPAQACCPHRTMIFTLQLMSYRITDQHLTYL